MVLEKLKLRLSVTSGSNVARNEFRCHKKTEPPVLKKYRAYGSWLPLVAMCRGINSAVIRKPNLRFYKNVEPTAPGFISCSMRRNEFRGYK